MSYRLLIVDDEYIILKRLKVSIDWQKLGIETVHTAGSGIDALKIIETEPPDIIITDVSMPELDGITLLKYIHERKLKISVILISGFSEFDYVKKGLDYGCIAYVLKPVDEDELLTAVSKAICTLELNSYSPDDKKHQIGTVESCVPSAVPLLSSAEEISNIISKVIQYVNENFADNEMCSKSVAEAFYFTPSYFSRLFSSEMGIHFTQYLTNLRIEKAEYLMRTTNMRFTDIAKKVGFNNERYFYTTYKRIRGYTPSEYRNNHS